MTCFLQQRLLSARGVRSLALTCTSRGAVHARGHSRTAATLEDSMRLIILMTSVLASVTSLAAAMCLAPLYEP